MATGSSSSSSPANSVKTRTCLCSPTNHPGSFRCSLHKNRSSATGSRPSRRELAAAAAMAKALTLRAFLLQIIKPSNQDQKRRRNFQPRPSRFCTMNGGSGVAVS
ncbi:unnamed protein product [Linum tenue]|uniref:Serine-rich protein-like protein n=1 Tax=Linum tenue TaxID=586396 RepID=A0AAV0HXF7_9ROSI|nr:unnamed protein product [Linum tenue]